MGKVVQFFKEASKRRTYLWSTKEDNIMGITKERMLEIENEVSKVLSKNKYKEASFVDIVSIVKKAGFDVKSQRLDIETTGVLLVNDDKKEKLIVVNNIFKNPDDESDVVFKKSRFITAHEYGHFILHKEESKPIYAHRDTYHRTEPKELEADYFARSILMPYKQFKAFYQFVEDRFNYEEFTVEMLSRYFNVTRNKVRQRIKDLKILGA